MNRIVTGAAPAAEGSVMVAITPAVMIGGTGTRLWPLSRTDRPKQFHSIGSDLSLVQQTLARFSGAGYDRPWLLASESGAAAGEAHAAAAGIALGGSVIEPSMRSTAAALAAAAYAIGADDPGRLILAAPADHLMAAPADFHRAVAAAVPAALDGSIVTFGIRPTHPETGFGYIELDEGFDAEADLAPVSSFREKPARELAEQFLAGGRHLWNAGIFLFSASTLLDEVERHAPAIASAVRRSVVRSRAVGERLHLDAEAYAEAPDLPIDTAVMEKSDRIVVAPCDPGWSDVGSWAAVHEMTPKDEDGNAFSGSVVATRTRDCLVHSTGGRLVAVAGLDGVVVVDTADATLVVGLGATQAVKDLVGQVTRAGRSEASVSAAHERSWGELRRIGRDSAFSASHLRIHPGRASEAVSSGGGATLTVVAGIADVEFHSIRRRLRPGRSVEVPPETDYVVVNVGEGQTDLVKVEVTRAATVHPADAGVETVAVG